MLVARRDPPFHMDADEAASIHSDGSPTTKASGFTRFLAAVQIIGSLLAVPIGIASAYSFYRTNFSPETTCQTLRSGIISLLDKSVDATTRRALVRRDVETFEKTCAAVDPEATAAFKTLLTAEKPATPPSAAPAAPESIASRPKEAVRKVEPAHPQTAVKQPVAATPPAVAEPVRRDAAVSDSQWLDAVRQALVTHKPEPTHAEAIRPQSQPAPIVRPMPQETTASSPAAVPTPAAAPTYAPALPPAITVTPPPVQRVDADHPVPPQSIPDPVAAPQAGAAKSDEQGRSRIGKWISKIPLLGPVVDNARN
ncbi:MAG TPA: hypothetical protein VEH02_09695 [Pseudolabrys sp.]|nr:hypothetical protein [Pseudolabrys sp.]